MTTTAALIPLEQFDIITATAEAEGWTVDNSSLTGEFVNLAAEGRTVNFVKGDHVVLVTWNRGGYICLGQDVGDVYAALKGITRRAALRELSK